MAGQRDQPGDHVGVEGRTGNAIQVFDPKAGSLRVLDSGPAVFTALAWRKESNDLAALRSIKQDGYDGESYAALAWKNLGETRSVRVDAPRRIVASRPPQWSEDGAMVFVGAAEWLKKPAGKKSDDDPATVEVWHWKDENVISEQKLTATRDRDRNLLMAWHVSSGRLAPLATNVKEQVRLARHGGRALSLDGVPYQNDAMFGRSFTDLYKVNLETGARALVAKHLIPPLDFSPGGRYALNFQDGHFQAYDLESGVAGDISKGAPAKFTNQENDYPVSQKPAYGIAGWTKNDRSVIVYDAYDLWELFPDGSSTPRRLTDGRAEEIRHRYVRTTPQPGGGRGGRGGRGARRRRGMDRPGKARLSKSGRQVDQADGLCPAGRRQDGTAGLQLISPCGAWRRPRMPIHFSIRLEAWNQSPNFFTAGADLKDPQKATNTNPFAAEYPWGRAELVDYKNSHGERLQGALYYPANYERGKQYPMIVQIYEIMSTQLHSWMAPSERTTYNATVWTQNGYFVYRPDIVFRRALPASRRSTV